MRMTRQAARAKEDAEAVLAKGHQQAAAAALAAPTLGNSSQTEARAAPSKAAPPPLLVPSMSAFAEGAAYEGVHGVSWRVLTTA